MLSVKIIINKNIQKVYKDAQRLHELVTKHPMQTVPQHTRTFVMKDYMEIHQGGWQGFSTIEEYWFLKQQPTIDVLHQAGL